jgi:cephalosporin-C deacetylase
MNTPPDPTYGYDLERLLTVPAPVGPVDFAEFWERTFEETMRVPLRIERREIASPHAGVKVWEVEFDSLDGVRIGGWITMPADGKFVRGVVAGHGYGGRSEPAPCEPGLPAVSIYPCARGFDRSARPDIPNQAAGHVRHGIENRETYVFRGCAADLWCAASVLIELYPEIAGALHYSGGSFGGGIGALALPWDKRFRTAYLDVPSFGNHPLRVQLPCVGSGESVRLYYKRHPEVLDVLAYFDAATAARYIHIPVFVAAALSDPAVPPPGQYAVYNGLAGPKKLYAKKASHCEYPEEQQENAELWEQVPEWLATV